jgi:hypothetical protein
MGHVYSPQSEFIYLRNPIVLPEKHNSPCVITIITIPYIFWFYMHLIKFTVHIGLIFTLLNEQQVG